MATFLNNNSSTASNNMQRFLEKAPRTTVLASCYSVTTSTSVVDGFHYSTTPGAGAQCPFINPMVEEVVSSNLSSEHKGEATHTIPEECERLFCDSLSAIFFGERRISRQESLGVDAGQVMRNHQDREHVRIEKWIEVLDYTSDYNYRGFVTDMNGERTLFVFFGEAALGHDLKTGLIALFELADISAFECSQIVACIPRSQDVTELEITRNLGWCGFSLTTLQPWNMEAHHTASISPRWVFLSAEV
ncbi:hypothetical protein FE257_009787 [Aspergillus nanangensis]|uniref:Ornithine decarboxylase antizyme n=1 Tax=Aspergillus nanangensis TaxID=2582783 RepID=A0AAD4GSG5_ASPNN|nr:hypothetical protein FE257_009787 [Aspergillus nanangensis]